MRERGLPSSNVLAWRSTSVQVDGTVTVMRPSWSTSVVVPAAGVVVVVVGAAGDVGPGGSVTPGSGLIAVGAADTSEPSTPIPPSTARPTTNAQTR